MAGRRLAREAGPLAEPAEHDAAAGHASGLRPFDGPHHGADGRRQLGLVRLDRREERVRVPRPARRLRRQEREVRPAERLCQSEDAARRVAPAVQEDDGAGGLRQRGAGRDEQGAGVRVLGHVSTGA